MRTNLKKLTSVCLAVIMILGVLTIAPLTASAAETDSESVSETSGDFEYEFYYYDSECYGEVEISGYNGNAKNLEIPSTLDGYTVIGIGWGAFYGCTSLESVTIPDSVSYISWEAFSNCTSLKSVTIPDGVTLICSYAFENCVNLADISIPDSVTSVGNDAFYNTAWYDNQPDGIVYASNVVYRYKGDMPENTSIVLKDGTCSLADDAFSNCENLVSITIPDSVTEIGGGAFYGCTGLTDVSIGNGVTDIYYSTFYNCTSLTSITIPVSVLYIDDCSLGYYEDDYRYDIPVDGFTIYGYTGSVAEIYANDNGFEFISIGEVPADYGIEYYMFDDGTAAVDYYIGAAAHLEIPSTIDGYTVTGILWGAFYDCTSLESVIIPDSVEYIDDYAFENCTSLTSITIPSSVTYIGECALGYYIDYEDEDWSDRKIDGFTIFGYTGTAAEDYAIENGFTFIALDGDLKLGDVNGDGNVTVDDVTNIQKYIAVMLSYEYTDAQVAAADVNKDGNIDVDDVTLIQKYIAGMVEFE